MILRLLTQVLVLFIVSVETMAQSLVSGKVIDSLSLEPIAFANITLEDGKHGTTSNTEGNFSLLVPAGYTGRYYFSHVSYKKNKLFLDPKNSTVKLQPSSTLLGELTFVAEENPAWKVIRKAIANKNINNPKKGLSSYQYIAYNKFLVTTNEPDKKTDSLIERLVHVPDTVTLTANEKYMLHFDSLASMSHLFLSESVTEKKVINPEKEKEKLLALHVSGYKSPLFTNVATDYQPFSFYEDVIFLLGKDYLNPISKGTFSAYNFYLIDTTYHGADSVYIIQFEPRPGKDFNSLSGMISISTDGFAIKNVIASTTDPTELTGIRIQQNYEKIDGHWFPVELNTDLDFHEYDLYGRTIRAQHRTFLKEIRINPSLDRKEFGDFEVELSAPQKDQNAALLSQYQNSPLTTKELKTYQVMDSVMRKIRWLDQGLEALVARALPAGPVDIDLSKIMMNNRYETVRLGGGLLTNDRFSKVVKLGGYYGFGFRDKQSKYGGELRLSFNQNKDFFVRFSSIHDIYETGSFHRIHEGQFPGNEVYRIWTSSRYDKLNSYKAELGYRLFQDLHTMISIANIVIRPAYDYNLTLNGELKYRFDITEAGLAIRYVRDESYMSLRGRKIFLSQQFPVITASIAKAIGLFGANDFHYSRYDFSLKHQIRHRKLGNTKLSLAAGLLNGIAPYGQLYNGRGARSTSFVVDDYFQTMGLYEFAATQFASVFVHHNFGNVLIHESFSKPELLVFHNMGIGALRHPEVHRGLALQSMDKGYVESGIGIANLLRKKYLKIGYIGLGASVFYRYGPYQLPGQKDNFVYRINLGFAL